LKVVVVLKGGKEVNNKVAKKEHNKDEGSKTIKSNLETKKENDPSPSLIMSDPTVTYKPRVSYPQTLEAPFPSRKDKYRDDILETFKHVKINLPLLEAIKQFPTYGKFLKNMSTFKRKSKYDKSKIVLLRE